jgi:hypothetical protein
MVGKEISVPACLVQVFQSEAGHLCQAQGPRGRDASLTGDDSAILFDEDRRGKTKVLDAGRKLFQRLFKVTAAAAPNRRQVTDPPAI